MTTDEAIEIRDRAKRLGLQQCCAECAQDIEILERLSPKGVGGFVIQKPNDLSTSARKPANLGSTMEDAARRLRRSIGGTAA